MDRLEEKIRKSIAAELESSCEADDTIIMGLIEKHSFKCCDEENMCLAKTREYIKAIHDDMLGFGRLQPLFEDSGVTEIMVNAGKVFYEKRGTLFKSDIEMPDESEIMKVIRTICRKSGRTVNAASPVADACLSDGTRINIVLEPVSVGGHSITIRKFPDNPITENFLVSSGFMSKEAAVFLKDACMARYNMFICGGAGTGKTTLLNVIANYCRKEERIVTIEDSAELKISGISNIVRLEAVAGKTGGGGISIRDLIRTSLRMRPDRIIVGEVRGGEALDMLQAMNTGHEGSVSTGHANSCRDLVSRLETMVLTGADMPMAAARNQIISALDILICLGRSGGKRHITEIYELSSDENGNACYNPLFIYDYTSQALIKKEDMRNDFRIRRAADV